MLIVENINVSYDDVPVLYNVSFRVKKGEVVSIIGSNSAGKSTILKTISGLLQPMQGSILLDGVRIERMHAHEIAAMGVAHVPEGRGIFSRLSVLQNLLVGAHTLNSSREREQLLERVFDLFPILMQRRNQKAGTLSGGELQMLTIARGLMLKPKLLMLDEPSLGLMPILVVKIFATIEQIKKEGLTILLVEQNVLKALKLANYSYVLQTGRVVLEGDAQKLIENDLVRKSYLGM